MIILDYNKRRAKILVVEDDTIVALDIKNILKSLNLKITKIAQDYNSALNSIRIEKPDLILIDIKLKGKQTGIDIARKICAIEQFPIIYLTAANDEQTIKKAIQTNPISYLIKPFKTQELKSNILLGIYKIRKLKKRPTENLDIGFGYIYNYEKDKLFYKKEPINLSSNETSLLKILIEANYEIVIFDEIEKRIWPNYTVSKSSLRTLIYRLRKKLKYELIETVQKVGCRLKKE